MRRKITDEYIDQQLKFGLSVAIAFDMLAKHENAVNVVSGVIAQILKDLGFSEEDSYGAAAVLKLRNMTAMVDREEASTALPALVSLGARVIRQKQIPDYVRKQVKETLAAQQ